MADSQGYTTHTHDIPVEVFFDMITNDIKKLIHIYGHKNCGLRHEELCEKIQTIITTKRTLILKLMDDHGREKLISEWRIKKNGFLNKLFEEEGFINMCSPKKNTNNPSLNQLLSRHIKFCKEKDMRRADVVAKPEYSKCVQYNSWIDTQRTSFTHEYLNNVRDFRRPNVHKYFSTKEHPGGHDPLGTYRKSKLDCELYNPTSERYQKKLVEKAPTNDPHLPSAPNNRRGSQGKDKKSVTGGDSERSITKPDANILPNTRSPTVGFQIPSPSQTKPDDIPIGQDTPVNTEGTASPVNVKVSKKDSEPIHHQPPTGISTTVQAEASPKDSGVPHVMQHSTSATATTSSSSSSFPTVKDTTSSLTITPDSSINSGSLSPADQLSPSPVTKDKEKSPHSTTTPVTSSNTNSTETLPAFSAAIPSLAQPQLPTLNTPPDVIPAQGLGTPASSNSSTITATVATTVTTTSAAPDSVTITTMNTMQNPISSTNEASRILRIPVPPPNQAPSGSKVAASATDSQQTPLSSPTPRADKDTVEKSDADASPKAKDPIEATGNSLSKNTHQDPENPPRIHVTVPDRNVHRTQNHRDQQISPIAVQIPPNIDVVLPPSDRSGDTVKTVKVNTKATSKDDSTVRTNKNDNPSIIPEGITPLKHIIPTFLVILATVTLLFQLYKYTPFGFLLGLRRKRRKRDLRRTFVIPEESTYESPNITVHELEDPNLVGQTMENDVYTKLLKINRYKQEMQKRKKKNKKTLIEVHMEVLEEYKSDEWKLHKGDFLEICLRGFVNDENDFYSNFPNSKLTINNINEKTIEDIQKQEILWNNWIEDHRNILEQWKKEEWFQILKNKWRNEEQMYKEKNNKLQENILNEQDTYSIVSQKEIWKQWISKQATLIDLFNKEDWFKSLVYVQDEEKDNYLVKEYNNITVTNENQLKNEKVNHEHGRSKNIIQKLMVQIHMMVLEECIKEEMIKQKELCIDNFIDDIHHQNNYDEKRNITQCDTDNFNVLKYDEIHTSKNK
ncbi:STP1 protein [Plasmodium ovale]|uniref:STP1 protein n=1 Tax=Plasmodium ovale TaxID=36330 RepID=A0A1C3KKY0_PLAOA|nr:STP1 protein [Plasmodium ovale]